MNSSWWMLGLIGSTTLFALLLVLGAVQRLRYRRIIHVSNGIPISEPIQKCILRKPSLKLSSCVTRIFVILVLQCAVLSLLSQNPASQSPLWLGLVLQGLTYASAFVYYIVIRDKGLEENS